MFLSVRNGGRIRRFRTASTPFAEKPVEKFARNHLITSETDSKLKNLISSGNLQAARQVFDEMPHRDIVSWTTIIQGYVFASNPEEALNLFSAMRIVDPYISPDSEVLSVSLRACSQSSNIAFGESLHAYAVKTSLFSFVFVGSCLLDMYKRVREIDKSLRVFNEMRFRNAVTWTTLISGLVNSGRHKEGLMYFSKMSRSKELLVSDSFVFPTALKACPGLRQVKEIHTHVVVKGFGTTLCVANSLANMYAKYGEMREGVYLFDSICSEIRDVVSWTSLMVADGRMGQEEKAVETFIRMRDSEVSPNEQTFASMFASCSSLSRLVWGEQLHCNVFSLGLRDHMSVSNSMMKMYSTCGKFDSVSALFRGMRCRDIISWTTVIVGYSQAGFGEEGFTYFSWMRQEGTKPTDDSLATLLSVSGYMTVLNQGRQVHALALHVGLIQKSTIRSSLINMYSECGSILEASKILKETDRYDIVSLTAMIDGYAVHGKTKEAIHLFEKSLNLGFRPDAVTFIGVLTACSHSGQLDLGFRYFELMQEKYNIRPAKEHYGCMVDLLCRAGRLSDAEKMINEMQSKKDDVVWTVLLRACNAKGDIERGRRAAERILELNPACSATHVTLANMYSSNGRWKEAANVRKSMKSRGVVKEPGWSSINIKNRVSEFKSGDRLHPQSENIYSVLDLVVYNVGGHRFDCGVKKAFWV